MSTIYVYRGVPGSGKSTAAREWVAEDPFHRIRINRDDIRYNMFGRRWDVDEKLVTKFQDASLRQAASEGLDIALDNTNLRSSSVRGYLKIPLASGYDVQYVDFPITIEDAIRRDAQREASVGEEVIRRFFERFIRDGYNLPPTPQLDTNPTVNFKPYLPLKHMVTAYGFDVDGTLAHMVDRGPYDTNLYHTDRVDERVRSTLWSLKEAGHHIIIFTGRSEDFRGVTRGWLVDNHIPHDKLIMRKSGDLRSDAIVKSELFDEHIARNYNFLAQFDDRNRVVDAFRAKGIKVYQVAPGDF